MTEKEFAKKREFETQVKEPNGKDLLLLLDVLVRELAYRTDMKMIQIELKSIDLLQGLKLTDNIKELVPQPLQDEYYRQQQETEQEPLQVKQITVASTSTNLVSDNEEDNARGSVKSQNDQPKNGKTETIPNAGQIKSQKSKSKSSRNRANSLDSDSHNIQSSPDVNNNDNDENGYNNNNNNNLSDNKDANGNPIEMQKLNSNEPDDE
eukprot:CAMPEP_0201570768 /NCGR_PEP_ID=MMETSP0190_2-20130828/13160_1 /ASSEMBLY_ACC=CAM_ASM_000263 /TAXON_ID=37353 /ORGANISM="Rosalina sp." /LENGTH=207 /DNA_ID=CAMNT_0047994659 /DNA_START=1135 /DNA_END=1758 /DNA_ORIENTATION=+